MQKERDQVTNRIQNFNDLVKQCIQPADQQKLIKLKKFNVPMSNIERLVKFRSTALKQKFKNSFNVSNECSIQTQGFNKDEKLQHEDQILKRYSTQIKNKLKQAQSVLKQKGIDLNFLQILQEFFYEEIAESINENKSQRFQMLFNQAQNLLEDEECEKKEQLIEDLKKNVLIKYNDYLFDNPRKFQNYLKCIESLPLYSQYKQYLGKNIRSIKQNFRTKLLKQLLSDSQQFTPKQIRAIQSMFFLDPMSNFQNQIDLSDSQKQKLFNLCWSNQQVEPYAQVFQTSKTLKFKTTQVIEDIMNFMIERGYVQARQHSTVIESLQCFDPIKFYSVPSITGFRKNVHEQFLKKNRLYYFYKREINGAKCQQIAKIEFILKIRKLLHDLKMSSSLYTKIQQILLQNKLLELWNLPIQQSVRQKVIQFYEKQDKQFSYNNILNRQITLKIKVQAQLQSIFLRLDFKNLSYEDIRNTVNTLIATKILPTTQLTPDQQRKFNDEYEKTNFAKHYIENYKIDEEQSKANLYQKMIYIFSKMPTSTSYQIAKKIIQDVLETCNFESIIDSLDLSFHQKNFLENQISLALQYQKYKEVFDKSFAIKSKQELKNFLQQKLGPNSSILYQYIWSNRKVIYGQDGKIKPESSISKKLDIIFQNKQEQIKKIQQESTQYSNFEKCYDFMLQEYKKDTQLRLLKSVESILYQCKMNSTTYTKVLEQNKFNFDLLPEQIKHLVKVKPIYMEYQNLINALTRAQQLKNRSSLIKYIDSLVYAPALRKYSSADRKQLIKGILDKGLGFLEQTQIIRQVQKDQIKNLITNSSQWQVCYPEKIEQINIYATKFEQKQQQLAKQQRPEKLLSNKKTKDQLIQDFVILLKKNSNCKNITNSGVKTNIHKDIYNNLDAFIKNIGVKGIMIVPQVRGFMMENKAQFSKLIDQIYESSQSQIKYPMDYQQIKIQKDNPEENKKAEQNEEKIAKKSEIKAKSKDEISLQLLNILKSCPEIPASLSQQKLISNLRSDIYDKPSDFLKSIGVGLIKIASAKSFLQQKRSEITELISQI